MPEIEPCELRLITLLGASIARSTAVHVSVHDSIECKKRQQLRFSSRKCLQADGSNGWRLWSTQQFDKRIAIEKAACCRPSAAQTWALLLNELATWWRGWGLSRDVGLNASHSWSFPHPRYLRTSVRYGTMIWTGAAQRRAYLLSTHVVTTANIKTCRPV